MQDINSLISPNSGWTLGAAYAINDSGQIVGTGTNPNGKSDAFLLTPIPEPSTLALLGISVIGLLACTWRRRRKLHNLRSMILATMVVLAAGSAQADVFNMPAGQTSLQLVSVGDPGNAANTIGYAYGSVGYTYRMGKYEVTAGQYNEFLNAVAKNDTHGLYAAGMWDDFYTGRTIARSGNAGHYSYLVSPDRVNQPITFVNLWDAYRFVNWLQNGQPSGAQTTRQQRMGHTRSMDTREPIRAWFNVTPEPSGSSPVIMNGIKRRITRAGARTQDTGSTRPKVMSPLTQSLPADIPSLAARQTTVEQLAARI